MKYITKLWKKAKANVESCPWLDFLSDMECFTKEELKAYYLNMGCEWGEKEEVEYADGLWKVEWDTIYGRHWTRYESHEEMEKAIAENEARYEVELRAEYNRLLSERKERIKAHRESRNTLGNLFPELSKLK